jgi:hypothetical protein
MSTNGFLTDIWGPMLWSVLHIISLNYPEHPEEHHKDEYYNFIISLQHVLPCGACRENMVNNLKTVKFSKLHSLKNRESFSHWVYDFHSEVNRTLNKTSQPTFEEMKETYEMFRAKCGKPKKGTEKGCIVPVNHVKTKCILSIIPYHLPTNGSIVVDKRCYPIQNDIGSMIEHDLSSMMNYLQLYNFEEEGLR